ncbi:hypothetical protein DFS34DRAFT_624907 [Phlyctochytrium arcticum]|nr:hypothetical protein DFS34DRAFT_624907 [Phlyctochytrium arcticum]
MRHRSGFFCCPPFPHTNTVTNHTALPFLTLALSRITLPLRHSHSLIQLDTHTHSNQMPPRTESNHRPSEGRPYPVSLYRFQLRHDFAFADAEAQIDYLRALGSTHVYLSPYLQASPGSAHGYDVVNHSLLNPELGGTQGFDALIKRVKDNGLAAIADIVPNHVSVADPENLNPYWWDTLRSGRQSKFAHWFDIDWNHPELSGKVLLPVLGDELENIVKKGELQVEELNGEPILRYWSHVFPLKPGTEGLKDNMKELLEAQNYKLAFWRVTLEGLLNYRRFFDVTTLAGIRVEDKEVFNESHKIFIEQLKSGALDGLRVDHPDGLADPQQYVENLAQATNGSWVVIEKILEEGEELPSEWPCAGTSGYDSLIRLTGLLIDKSGETPLTEAYQSFTGLTKDFHQVVDESKHFILQKSLIAEVERLVSLLLVIQKEDPSAQGLSHDALRDSLIEFLVGFKVYRAYIQPGQPIPKQSLVHLSEATEYAKRALSTKRDHEIEFIARAAAYKSGTSDAAKEFVSRLQQTCGPVMAKGIEDTAFYRYFRLTALNEVGGDPAEFGKTIQEFHEACQVMQKDWPLTMTTLSTHDTKRAEDVRARLAVLSEFPQEWSEAVAQWSSHVDSLGLQNRPDKNTEYLFWQTLVGAYPISTDRLAAYMDKAIHESKVSTSHTDPNPAFDASVKLLVETVLSTPSLLSQIESFVEKIKLYGRLNALTQKAIQLTMPGIPDVYQGCELEDYSLVDPDNRRPVDYTLRRTLLAKLDGKNGGPPDIDDLGTAKLYVTSRLLRLRRDHADVFVGPDATYTPIHATGPRSDNLIAFLRSNKILTIAPRLHVSIRERGGWQGTTITVPEGRWRDVLSGKMVEGGQVPVEEVVSGFPVAVLVKE